MSRYDDPGFDDGSQKNFENERQAMLDDFQRKLAEHPHSLQYDEDEWVILADYASDMDNFYLFTEAVIRGLSAYPDSPDLNDRRLLLINDVCNPDEVRTAFGNAVRGASPSKIALIYKAYYDWEDGKLGETPRGLCNKLMEIFLDSEQLNDQETIEAIHVIADAGGLPMVARDMDRWSRFVEYTETLLFEVAATAYEQSLYDIAAATVNKLIDKYPYNHKYWLLKARIHYMQAVYAPDDAGNIREDAFDESVNAIDTALAIQPDDEELTSYRSFIDDFIRQRDNAGAFDTRPGSLLLYAEDGKQFDVLSYVRTTPPEVIFDNMTTEMTVALWKCRDKHALALLRQWAETECHRLNNSTATMFGTTSRLYDILHSLYFLEEVYLLDDLLQQVDYALTNKAAQAPLLYLMLVRQIENGHLDNARRLVVMMSHDKANADSPSLLLLTSVIEGRYGNDRAAVDAYVRYRTTMFNLLRTPADSQPLAIGADAPDLRQVQSQQAMQPAMTDAYAPLHPVVAHFAARSAYNSYS